MENLTFKIDEADVGTRLDAFLADHVEHWSRSRLQRLIDTEDVLVNAKPSKSSYKLRLNDEIEVELNFVEPLRFEPENIPLEIIFEDDTLLIVNKPAGLVVHPAAGNPSGTLANALAYHFQQLPSGRDGLRPGIVHRLDRDTSGIMVVAKTDRALEHLSDQFRERSVFKSYVALVHGRVEAESGRVEQPLARDPTNRTRIAVVAGGRSALTRFKVRKRYGRFTLLDVDLKTGRTHQIRVHLAWLKHPVVADETYGAGRDNMIQDAQLRARIRHLGRQFLHAEKLAITHPVTGERLQFESNLPENLADLLADLEG